MNIESLLSDYAEWRNEPPLQFPSPKSISAKCVDMQHNAGISASGMRYDTYEIDGESFQARPDGGMGDICDRMGRQIRRDHRMRSLQEMLSALPDFYATVFAATYHVGPRDRPRGAREAAKLLGMTHDAYRLAKERMLGWIERAAVGRLA